MEQANDRTIGLAAGLSTAFATLLLLSNVLSTKIITIFGLANDAGTLIYPLTFMIRDLIQKRFGRKFARKVIWISFSILAFAYFMFWLVGTLNPDPSWTNQAAYNAILMPFGRLVAASIIAGIISELLDTTLFTYLWRKVGQMWVVLASNLVGLLIDTALFATIAFAGMLPNDVVLGIFITNVIVKLAMVTIVSPSILLVRPTNPDKI